MLRFGFGGWRHMGLVSAAALELMGRECTRRGEMLFVIESDMRLTPAATWDVRGPADRRQWWYRVDTFGASEHQTRLLPGDQLIHLMVNVDPTRPWVGRASHRIACATSETARRAEGGVNEELKMLRRRILSVPGTEEQVGQILSEVTKKAIVGVASGAKLNPVASQDARRQWEPARMGPELGQADVQLRSDAAADILGAVGVPSVLFDGRADGTARREGFRQLLHGLVQPWGLLFSEELSAKLDRKITLNFDRLFAADLSGRARAFQSMVGGGMDVAAAAGLAGLMVADG